MRRSIFVRILAVTVLVAMCSIAATAWIAAQITRTTLQQEQGRELAADNNIYTSLLTYAVTHKDWSEVRYVVNGLIDQHPNRRIALLTKDRKPIVDFGGDGAPLPATASAEVDALAVNPLLVPDAPADRIDKRVLGPFRTPINDRVREDNTDTLTCLRFNKTQAKITPGFEPKDCFSVRLPTDTAADFQALMALEDLVNVCLARRNLPPVELNLHYTPARSQSSGRPIPDEPTVAACVKSSRQEQLAPYVAPAALLFVTSPTGTPTTSFDLSSGNWGWIAGVAAAILLVVVAVTATVCIRLVRPLQALTSAAHRMAAGDATPHVPVRGRDEISQLTTAFNTMTENRERLEQSRKVMVSDIAHELRTPLSNIRGWLEAAQDGISERDPALIALLLKESLMLQRIVDDLQDLAAADAGKLHLHQEQILVTPALQQLRATYLPRAAQGEITLSASAPENLTVNADPVRLRQMLGNLVTNALRHVPPGGSITVTAEQDGPDVVFKVVDTGTGISPQDLPHVFDRFWRAEKSRSRQTGGSGLGLAIVRKLAETHGGTAQATSVLGQGSTFTLRIPV
ncbi:two-component system sensor histidine kinase BaeS [Kibdelosporangium banguiense]|uniref:histidine kinase n=1 Tax=Kibdelosporangium banguiense TaxID=1365924 RepID=A0ABS4TQ94_9PSEU|nr:ATP-binding protein [Kibdelosporangium banguiense]MBP2326568.1 two-component system sensor histidine kinase BaeS [Kibdelosporangium banguiense]